MKKRRAIVRQRKLFAPSAPAPSAPAPGASATPVTVSVAPGDAMDAILASDSTPNNSAPAAPQIRRAKKIEPGDRACANCAHFIVPGNEARSATERAHRMAGHYYIKIVIDHGNGHCRLHQTQASPNAECWRFEREKNSE